MSDMGIVQEIRQSTANGPAIVAFDFDGTLTIRDSFTEFLRWRAGPGAWALGLVKLAPALAAYAKDRDRGRIKAASVKEFLLGVSRQTLEAEAAAFADEIWPRFMRPDALEVWNDWGQRGAHRVIVTASPTTTVAPFARKLGAEALLGMGDMLYMPSGTGFPIRVHGAFVSDEEVHRVVSYLKSQGEPDYIEGVLEGGTTDDDGGMLGEGDNGEKDPMYDQAVEVVLKNRKASISLVQRHLKIGYNRAARLVEDMEKAGLVSAMSGSGQREILVPARAE